MGSAGITGIGLTYGWGLGRRPQSRPRVKSINKVRENELTQEVKVSEALGRG